LTAGSKRIRPAFSYDKKVSALLSRVEQENRLLMCTDENRATGRAAPALMVEPTSNMRNESELKAEIGHVLLIDIVGADLALTNMGLGERDIALNLAERGTAANPVEKDAILGPAQVDVLGRIAAQTGETDRAVAALEKALSIPYVGWTMVTPLTPALLRMFDPLRNDPRFQRLTEMKP